MKNPLTLKQVTHGYLLAIHARHLSEHTIRDYQNTLNKFIHFVGADIPFNSIVRQDIERFLSSYKTSTLGIEDENPEGVITKRTLLHYYTALAAMWTWAVDEGIADKHVVHSVTAPKPEQREIIPFTEAEFKLLLGASARSKAYTRPGKRKSTHALEDAERNRAILLTLLDTGFRANELCGLKLYQVDQRNHRIQVLGKGALERSVPYSPRTAQALWRYLATRPNAEPNDPLFATARNKHIDRCQLGKFLKKLGERAGVENVHPHRFRHTFAIQLLRNGADPYTLQKLLGHSTLDMVKKYLALAQIDLDKAHKRASPVDNWSL